MLSESEHKALIEAARESGYIQGQKFGFLRYRDYIFFQGPDPDKTPVIVPTDEGFLRKLLAEPPQKP